MKPADKQYQQGSDVSRESSQPQTQSGGKVTSQQSLELSAVSSAFTELQKQPQPELDYQAFKDRLDHRLDSLDITRTSSLRRFLDAQFAGEPGWEIRLMAWIVLLALIIAAAVYTWQLGMEAETGMTMSSLISTAAAFLG